MKRAMDGVMMQITMLVAIGMMEIVVLPIPLKIPVGTGYVQNVNVLIPMLEAQHQQNQQQKQQLQQQRKQQLLLLLMFVDPQNMLMIDGAMMRTIMLDVTGIMELVVVTMLTNYIVNCVNAMIPMLELNFMKSMLE